MRTFLRGKVTLLFMTFGLLLAVPAIALADNFQNTLTATEIGTRTITTDGTTPGSTTVGYRIIATGGDGSLPGQNCNASDGTPLGVSFSVANVTASPSSLSFTSCGTANTQNVAFSSTKPGTYIIDPVLTDTGAGTYQDQSAFTLHVQGTGTSVTDVSGSGTEGLSDGSLSAKLVWNNNNVGGKTVSFAIDKAKDGTFTTVGSATTDNTTGVATLNNVSLAGLAPGTYDLKATFAGDNNYAGDDTTGTLTVNSADDVAPTSTHSLSADANGNGWHNSDVTVTLNATDNDGGSGVDEIRYSINGGAASVYDEANKPVISTEGTTTFSYFAVDNNNNVEDPANSFQIKLDKTAPDVAYKSASPAANAAGWNNTNVTATFEATDSLSGMGATDAIKTATGTTVASDEGASVTVGSPAFTDRAGNTAPADTATSDPFKIDKTAPTVTVTGVSLNGTYVLGSVPTAGCSTSDDLSGKAQDATVSVTGGTTNGVGTFTATCSGGKDVADNTRAPVSVTYKVLFVRDGGILQPINPDNTSVFSRGKAVPVKFKLAGDEPTGFNVSGWTLQKVQVNCTNFDTQDAVVEQVAENPSQSFRYDSSADQYIINADFKSQAAGTCWKAKVNLNDGTSLESAVFKLQK